MLTGELAAEIGLGDVDTDSGTSSIIAPDGTYLAGPKWEGEGIVHADIDLADRTRAKAFHDTTGHYNRFDVFTLEVDRSAREPVVFAEDRDEPDAEGARDDVERLGDGD